MPQTSVNNSSQVSLKGPQPKKKKHPGVSALQVQPTPTIGTYRTQTTPQGAAAVKQYTSFPHGIGGHSVQGVRNSNSLPKITYK